MTDQYISIVDHNFVSVVQYQPLLATKTYQIRFGFPWLVAVLRHRMADKSELLWHYIYMMAGREAEKADDRPVSQAVPGLHGWSEYFWEIKHDYHYLGIKYISHRNVVRVRNTLSEIWL